MPSQTTPPSAAELSQLQQAFSKDPTSEAYYPLAAAYLASERFMEAIVVCKKGAKAFPVKPEPHILMSKIYSAQKKFPKALDEAKTAAELGGYNAETLVLLGTTLIKSGDVAGGKESLKKAIFLAPDDEAVIEACRENNVEIPKKETPPQPQPMVAPVAANVPTQVPTMAPQIGNASLVPTPVAPMMPQAQAFPAPNGVVASQTPYPAPQFSQAPQTALVPQTQNYAVSQVPQAASPSMRPQSAQEREAARLQAQRNYEARMAKYGDDDEEADSATLKAKSLTNVIILGLVFVVFVGGLAGFFYYKKAKAARETEIAMILKKMQEEISHDNYASYQKACEMGEKISMTLDPDLFSAHSFLAYAYAIRWGEHGEGDKARIPAGEHLSKAKKSGMDHSYQNAAEAYITYFQGNPDEAIRQLEAKISEQESKGQNSTLLISTLGILQAHAGNLESALVHLKRAQQAAPADPRISAWTGNTLRRLGGNDVLAANAYEQALRYEKNHAEAQLGVALMAVDANKPEAGERYINMLLKAEPPPSNRQLALARLAHAIILDGKGEKAEADAEEQRALAQDPNNGELYLMKSERQKRSGDMKGAIESVKEAIKKDGKRVSFQIALAEMLLHQSQKERDKEKKETSLKEARDSLKNLVIKSPNSIKLFVLLGKAEMYLGNYSDAETTFQKAMGMATKSVEKSEIFLEQGNLAVFQKKSEQAHKAYANSADSAGSGRARATAMIQSGHLYAQDGAPKKAIEMYAEAQSYDETLPDTYFFIGRILASNKEVKDAELAKEQLTTYLEKAPKGTFAEQTKRIIERLK